MTKSGERIVFAYSDIHYEPEILGFVLRCAGCASKGEPCFWPIDLEFWNPASMQRCRACNREMKNKAEKARRLADPEYQKRKNRAWAKLNKDRINLRRREQRATAANTKTAQLAPTTQPPANAGSSNPPKPIVIRPTRTP